MDVIFNSIYARAFMGAGLAVLSGIRAFLPIAFVALYSHLDFHSSPDLEGTVFAFFEKTWVVILLFVLAVIELLHQAGRCVAQMQRHRARPVEFDLAGGVEIGRV